MTAIIVLGPGGLPLAQTLRAALPDAVLHGFAPRLPDAEVTFTDVAEHLRDVFAAGEAIVGICAAGILIRALASLLADKRTEPPVVAVAEDGSAALPLLGGHHGANDLARRIAAITGGIAAITTAGDVRLSLALDAPPPGWRVGNPEAVKPVTAALLADEQVDLIIETANADCGWLAECVPLSRFTGEGQGEGPYSHSALSVTQHRPHPNPLPQAGEGDTRVVVTDGAIEPDDKTLILHPATLAVGVGCERGASSAEVSALVTRCLNEAGLSPLSVAGIFSIALKAAEPAIHAVAQALDVPARFFGAQALLAQTPRLTERSEIVFRETGCWGVAEGAALAAAGPAATLVVTKQRSVRATCAIARSPHIIEAAAHGRARGRLAIVGIGPGAASGRTAEAERAIRAATDIVGYRLYLDLLAPITRGKRLHAFALGEEEARVRAALALAAEGRDVALVSSGDAGIYAMGSLVFELIERSGNTAWARVEIASYPGVSAMQVAAARLGAPLGHDFCAISLSDLLTPWPVIEARLRAAAAGDFVIAFYNPVSRRRQTQLATARDILLTARSADTPVAIARNLGRDGESVEITTLGVLDPAAVDMLSIVLVGSRTTRLVVHPDGGRWMYTPRGYAQKAGSA
jgi:cobalt-precorrin 5A hydrolase/precorrin-3B C17-methyltransferase